MGSFSLLLGESGQRVVSFVYSFKEPALIFIDLKKFFYLRVPIVVQWKRI